MGYLRRRSFKCAIGVITREVIIMDYYEYGYIIQSKGESRRVVLGKVDAFQYEPKKKEIESANYVTSKTDNKPGNTRWLIERI